MTRGGTKGCAHTKGQLSPGGVNDKNKRQKERAKIVRTMLGGMVDRSSSFTSTLWSKVTAADRPGSTGAALLDSSVFIIASG